MHTVQFLRHLVEDNQILAYFLIFLGLIFEGEITLISAGVLSHLGALDFWTSLGVIFAGGMIKTFLGYYVGLYLHKKYNGNKFFTYVERRVLYLIPRFKQRPFWSIFLSKFIMGVNYLVVIFSGYQRINLKTYLKAEILSTVTWAPLLLSMGYFFSYTALHISRDVGKFLLVIVAFTVAFLLIDKLVGVIFGIFEQFESANEKK